MTEPRLCVGIMVVNEDKDVFVAKRFFKNPHPKDEYWQMPQGGIDEGETPYEAMLRELFEETGIKEEDIEVIAQSKNWYVYEIPSEYQTKEYDAQKIKWFLVKLHGSDDVVKLKRKHQEFSEWKWTSFKTLAKSVIPFKKEVYKEAMHDFDWYF